MSNYIKPYEPIEGDTIYSKHIRDIIASSESAWNSQKTQDMARDLTIRDTKGYRDDTIQYAIGVPTEPTGDSALKNKDNAVIAKDAAVAAQGLAETAQGLSEGAQGLAETAQGLSEDARDESIQYAIGEPSEPPEGSSKYWASIAADLNTNLLINSDFASGWYDGISNDYLVGDFIADLMEVTTAGTVTRNFSDPANRSFILSNGIEIKQDISYLFGGSYDIMGLQATITVGYGEVNVWGHDVVAGTPTTFTITNSDLVIKELSSGFTSFTNLKVEVSSIATPYVSPYYTQQEEYMRIKLAQL